MQKKTYHLWIWSVSRNSWVIQNTYKSAEMAHYQGKILALNGTKYSVATVGSQKDEHILAHMFEDDAPDT